jgi:uncharacterized protein (DUF58 family)
VERALTLTPEALLRRLEWRVVRRLDGQLQGDYRSLFRGTGVDFLDLREYVPGDDLRHIDWNVTARTDTAHVRVYVEDREVTAWLVLDRSPSMGVGPVARQKDHVVADVATTLAHVLTRGGNRVGAVLFTDAVEATIPPGQGRRQVLRIAHQLLQPRPGPSGSTDLGAALRAAYGLARRRSLVVVVSDFISEPGWDRPLALLAERHDVVAIHVADRRESDLPAVGMVYVEDAETGEQIFVDTDDAQFRDRLRAAAERRRADVRDRVQRAGTTLFTIQTDEDLVRALVRVSELRRRGRQ